MNQMITIDIDRDGIALLTIDLKDHSMNVLGDVFRDEFEQSIARIRAESAIKGAVITSAKSTFVAGGDLKTMVNHRHRGLTDQETFDELQPFQQLLRELETCGKPVAVAINGTALGGGLELCLCCHYRVCSDNSAILLGLPEAGVGLLPAGGGTQRLPRLIGVEKALDVMLSGRMFGPAEAHRLGIIDELVPAKDIVAAAKRWVRETGDCLQPWDKPGYQVPGGTGGNNETVAALLDAANTRFSAGSRRHYPAPMGILAAVKDGVDSPIEDGLELELRQFVTLLQGTVAANITRTLFINKGATDKLKARPRGVERRKFSKVGVVGAGMMGGAIAFAVSRAGLDVVLLDREQSLADSGKHYARKKLEKSLGTGTVAKDQVNAMVDRIAADTDYGTLADCELVIEAVAEDLQIKADVYRKIISAVGEDTLIASNTSSYPIADLCALVSSPQRFLGLHFFSPADQMPLVEVIRGGETSDETLAHVLDFAKQLRKTPVVLDDGCCFYVNRNFLAYIMEGALLVGEGVDPALIEAAAVNGGMAVGPLAVTDEVSQDLVLKIAAIAQSHGLVEVQQPALELLNKLILAGRPGRKGSAGYYDYVPGGPKELWSGLVDIATVAAQQPVEEDVLQRLLTAQTLAAVRCLESGILKSPADGDVAAVLGMGFPTYLGGPFGYVDTLGIQAFVEQCSSLAERYGPRFEPTDGLLAMAAKRAGFYPPEV